MVKKILVVDDESDVRKYVNSILSEEGYFVTLADDGEPAIRMLKEKKHDLILTDSQMNWLGGLDLISIITDSSRFERPKQIDNYFAGNEIEYNKFVELYKNVPIIMMSKSITPIIEKTAKKVGAVDTLSKPFERNELVSMIQKYI